MLVIFFDGLCEPKNPGGASCFGFVIYKNNQKIGEGSGLATQPFRKHSTNNYAEYTALIKALVWALEKGYAGENLQIKGDSRLVVRQLNGEYAVRSQNIRPLYLKARALLKNFSWQTSWIPRERNKEADALSQEAYRKFWLSWKGEEPPIPRWKRAKKNSNSREIFQ